MLSLVLADISSFYSYKYFVAFLYFKNLFFKLSVKSLGHFHFPLGLPFLQCSLGENQVSWNEQCSTTEMMRNITSSAKLISKGPECMKTPWVHFHLVQIWKVLLASALDTVDVGLTHFVQWMAFRTESSNLSKSYANLHQLRIWPKAFSLFDIML